MSTGGRIVGHEARYLPDPNNIILFIGFQVKGTLGRRIKDGEKKVNIMGEQVDVRAEVREISGYSAHGDQTKLLNWLDGMCDHEQEKPKRVFIVHGEPEVSTVFGQKISENLKLDVAIPKENEEFIL